MQEINTEICFEFKKYRRLIIWWYKRKKRSGMPVSKYS